MPHTGVFMSSWTGTALLSLGEWTIKRVPLVKHIYSAAKQVRQQILLKMLCSFLRVRQLLR